MDSQGHTLCYGGVGWGRACPPVIRRHRKRPLYVCLLSPECHAAVHTPQGPPLITHPDTHRCHHHSAYS